MELKYMRKQEYNANGFAEIGNLIVFEGIDGCGKTSIIEKVAEVLKEKLKYGKDKIVIFSNIEEGSTTGTAIRTMLTKDNDTISHNRMALLYLSELNYVVEKDKGIWDYLKQGYIVLCSRWFYSTYAYTNVGKEMSNIIVNSTKVFPKPSLVVYLKVDVDVALERLAKNGKSDFFEKKDKLKKVTDIYNLLFKEKIMINTIAINNESDFDENVETISDLINSVVNLKYIENNIK